MKRSLLKLFAVVTIAVIALVIVVASSYAWMSLSSTPTASAIQVNIGGANTVLIAPNITETVDGETVHYPGRFSESMNFATQEAYAYLREITDLTPVSTADGIHWYFPAVATQADGSEFLTDNTLTYANLQTIPSGGEVKGGYAMLDFWVVSPTDATLRISTGTGKGGSYVVGLPKPASDGRGGYSLSNQNRLLAACARVGLLADTQAVRDGSMNAYVRSAAYDSHYRSLKGIYQESGETWSGFPAQFTIYEPNGDRHHEDGVYVPTDDGRSYRLCENGTYIKTNPLANNNGQPAPTDVLGNTTVQLNTDWQKTSAGDYRLEQIFQAYLRGVSSPEKVSLFDGFYREYLGYQCTPYLQKGVFIRRSADRLNAADEDGVVDRSLVEAMTTAGATDDVTVVELQQDVPQRIRMFVWVEGQDVDCAAAASGGGLLVSMELAASTN